MTADIIKTYKTICAQAEQADAKPYLILDGAWQEELIARIRQHEDGWEPLMGAPSENKQETHWRSPLVVDLGIHSFAHEEWIAGDFKEKIGIVVFSKQDIAALRRSLKRFLQVITPESTAPVYFRFFDARTLYCFMRFGFRDQWADFFRDIALIAAPYDYTNGWAIYRFDNPALKFATEQNGDWSWHTFENKDRVVEQYNITFPFRTISQQQYDDMMHCAQQSFYHEIREKMQTIGREMEKSPALLSLETIGSLAGASKKFRCEEEDAVMYFCVMGYLFGPDFYKTEDLFTERMKYKYRLAEELLAEILNEYASMTGSATLRRLAQPWVQ